ncbi:MAG: hypothetical protein QOF03_1673 [Alphaproteobacteria bacterium]|jgi:uncharacterized membrane protein YhaH (DUF805 family)|nr:hypothetical protein [Alphaproteobacteria bacterium]
MEVKHIIESFRRVLTGHYADFKGRAARTEFWRYILVYLVISILLDILGIRLLSTMVGLALLVPTLAITVRRLHDVDRSGWLVLVPIVPAFLTVSLFYLSWLLGAVFALATLLGSAYLIYLYVLPGMVGPNQFGADPKGVTSA